MTGSFMKLDLLDRSELNVTDLGSSRLYTIVPASASSTMRELISGKLKTEPGLVEPLTCLQHIFTASQQQIEEQLNKNYGSFTVDEGTLVQGKTTVNFTSITKDNCDGKYLKNERARNSLAENPSDTMREDQGLSINNYVD